MKKVLKSLALTGSMLAIAATAQAVNTVQVTLTSPSIIKSGCEQFGSYTVTFDKGTQLSEGDWFYMDLPQNTSICKPIDYMIVGNRAVGTTTSTVTYDAAAAIGATNVVLAGGATTIPVLGSNGSLPPIVAISGPLTYANDNDNIQTVNNGSGIVLRVYAPNGGRRVWVYVYGATAGATGDSLLVANLGTNARLTLHLLDGLSYNGTLADQLAHVEGVAGNIILNTGGGTTWGDSATDDISNLKNVPHVEDTLCASAPAATFLPEVVNVSYSSLNSFLTFTGDSQIAHTNTVDAITMTSCSSTGGKGGVTRLLDGNILMPGAQANGCIFEYETAFGYCQTGPTPLFNGNRILLQAASSTSFGDPGNRFDMTLTSTTNGVYWSSAAVSLEGFTLANQSVALGCTVAGAAITPSPAFTSNAGFDAGTCTVGVGNRSTVLSTNSSGALTGLSSYGTVFVNMPALVYDKATVGVGGIESVVRVDIIKYPCGGTVFTDVRKLGTFVSSCPTVVQTGTTTLLYPFLPAMNSTDWWGSFTIVNGGANAGTCALTITDAENNTATYTTPSIPPAGQWYAGMLSDFASQVTAGSGNVSDANFAVVADCNFDLGGGFAFMGNQLQQAAGYTAYVQGKADNYNWQ